MTIRRKTITAGLLAPISIAAITLGGPAHATDPTPAPTPTAAPATDRAAQRLIVTYKEGQKPKAQKKVMAAAAAKARTTGSSVVRTKAMGGDNQLVVLDRPLKGQQLERYVSEIEHQPSVAGVSIDHRVRRADVDPQAPLPDDPRVDRQWPLLDRVGIHAPTAWKDSRGDGVTIAVVDTGITPHPDLRDKLVSGYDFISETDNARDGDGRDADATDEGDWTEKGDEECSEDPRRFLPSSWHGTHVAGIAAASTDNGTGIAGTAPESRIQPVRVLGRCGGTDSDIIDGMLWAAGEPVPGVPRNANPAKVLNVSITGPESCTYAMQDAVDRVNRRGAVVVVAAGNENENAANFHPASCRNVLTVGATDSRGDRAGYSNYGSSLSLSAPGGDDRTGASVVSTWNTGSRGQGSATYGGMDGTSMAAPHVAGVAAMMMSRNPSMTSSQVRSTIVQSVQPLPGHCGAGCGAGLLDAAEAVQNTPAR